MLNKKELYALKNITKYIHSCYNSTKTSAVIDRSFLFPNIPNIFLIFS